MDVGNKTIRRKDGADTIGKRYLYLPRLIKIMVIIVVIMMHFFHIGFMSNRLQKMNAKIGIEDDAFYAFVGEVVSSKTRCLGYFREMES